MRVERVILAGLLLGLSGCDQEPEKDLSLPSSKAVTKTPQEELPSRQLDPEIERILNSRCGTAENPRLLQLSKDEVASLNIPPESVELGYEKITPEQLEVGRNLYQRHCLKCHGKTGDGWGPQAEGLNPLPRDFRRGVFKFTSTPYGFKPRRDDLLRTITQGISGTAMPSFSFRSPEEQEAILHFVLALTHRGELAHELQLETDTPITQEDLNRLIALVLQRWKQSEQQDVQPMTPPPEFTAEHIERGKVAFETQGCIRCHGKDGRGETRENIGLDFWDHSIKAADLTTGELRGGSRPLDIYWRIMTGINGTPMPSFRGPLLKEPETAWNLVAYVLFLAGKLDPASSDLAFPR